MSCRRCWSSRQWSLLRRSLAPVKTLAKPGYCGFGQVYPGPGWAAKVWARQ